MPSPSFYPLILALGLPILGYAAVFKNPWLAIPGADRRAVRHVRLGHRARHRAEADAWHHRAAPRRIPSDESPTRRQLAAARRRAHPAGTATTRTTTGTVTNTKLGMWLFLSSDCLFFGAFIATYLLYRGRGGIKGPTPKDVYNIPFTSVTSFILLMSSLTMVLALAAIQRGDHRRFRIWLIATALFGATFIAGQIYEFTEFYPRGPRPRHERVRLELLRAHRLPRRARDRRHHLAPVAVGPLDAGPARGAALRAGRDRRVCTGTSSTWCGS